MSETLVPYLSAFLLTQLVETPIYRRFAPTTWMRAFLASAITHPIVWFVFFSERVPLDYEEKYVLAETFAVVVEALWMMRCEVRAERAFVLSFAANLASVLVGEVSRALVGWP